MAIGNDTYLREHLRAIYGHVLEPTTRLIVAKKAPPRFRLQAWRGSRPSARGRAAAMLGLYRIAMAGKERAYRPAQAPCSRPATVRQAPPDGRRRAERARSHRSGRTGLWRRLRASGAACFGQREACERPVGAERGGVQAQSLTGSVQDTARTRYSAGGSITIAPGASVPAGSSARR